MNKLNYSGIFVILLLILISVFAKQLAPYDPSEIDLETAYSAPSFRHLCGTDSLGRDIYSRLIYASRIALLVGIIAVGIATVIGVAIGAVSGYFGGKMDNLIMRFTDIMLAFPAIFLILAIVAIIGPGIINIMVVIGLTSWMGVARLIRAEVMSLKKREYVLAAKSLGKNNLYIITRHIIPNGIGPVLVNFVFGVAGAILLESSLSFLGLGIQPPEPSWGNMLMDGKSALGTAWWAFVFPGMAILMTVLAFNLAGEGLRDALNPRIKK